MYSNLPYLGKKLVVSLFKKKYISSYKYKVGKLKATGSFEMERSYEIEHIIKMVVSRNTLST